MDTLTQMEQLIQEMRHDAVKLYQQNTKVYAVQLRAKAQTMKVLAQKMREEAHAHQHSIVGRGKNKTVGGAPTTAAQEPEQEIGQEPEQEPAAVRKPRKTAQSPGQ